jgi:hypothetical protein
MQELVGRLTALDPEASETLKVITYFDALVGAGAGIEALLRAAATLSGVTAGVRLRDRIHRREPGGRRVEGEAPVRSPRREIVGGEVWLERGTDHLVNDEMVVERLALAVTLTVARHQPEAAIEVAVDSGSPIPERVGALARLRIEPAARVRAIAIPLEATEPGSVPMAAGASMVRALVDEGGRPLPTRAGVGLWVRADRLPESWDAATTALRLTGPAHPIVDAGDLGALLLVVRGFDPAAPPDDVRVIESLDERSREVLDAVVRHESLRAASAALGMHHSTVQARHEALTRDLGYDPRSTLGRARYVAAELLLRLRRTPSAP